MKLFKITLTVIILITLLIILFHDTIIEIKLLMTMSMFIAIVLTWLEYGTTSVER